MEFYATLMTITRHLLIILSVAILFRCLRSLLSDKYEREVWAYIRAGQTDIPVCHWENIIGRSLTADVRVKGKGIKRVHAVLSRADSGSWRIQDVFERGNVWVNETWAGEKGLDLQHGDIINLGDSFVRFLPLREDRRGILSRSGAAAGKTVAPWITLLELSLFEVCLLLQLLINCRERTDMANIAAAFTALILLEWCVYLAMLVINKTGFEVETLAFYLTSLGMAVTASSTPEDMFKQLVLTVASVLLFIICGIWLRNLKRSSLLRVPVAIISAALLLVNVLFSEAVFGAKNWLDFGGYSFQPSEFVKFGYIYVGAATLDILYKRTSLYWFIGFSAACVVAIALIGDFGTALVFFVCFLIISFLRSGSLATVLLAISGAGLAGFLAVSVKPYIARRFAVWGRVWEDVFDTGYQQTRAMSAAASGGLLGKGAGSGWLKNIVAAKTDMVFAVLAEELGLIIAFCAVLALVVMAFFAVRTARKGRSAFYSIAACASMAVLLTQLGLNVFGSLDILPFTGVTFPFVSKGGSSLISCWMMMSFLKCADTRKDASFAVRSFKGAVPEGDNLDDLGEFIELDEFREDRDL